MLGMGIMSSSCGRSDDVSTTAGAGARVTPQSVPASPSSGSTESPVPMPASVDPAATSAPASSTAAVDLFELRTALGVVSGVLPDGWGPDPTAVERPLAPFVEAPERWLVATVAG
jgi:hypothetical protein